MPDLNIRNVDRSLLREVNTAAAKAELTQRDWVIKALTLEISHPRLETKVRSENESIEPRRKAGNRAASSAEVEREVSEPDELGGDGGDSVPGSVDLGRGIHHAKTCRVYGCMMCKLLGHKDEGRGLK